MFKHGEVVSQGGMFSVSVEELGGVKCLVFAYEHVEEDFWQSYAIPLQIAPDLSNVILDLWLNASIEDMPEFDGGTDECDH